jgi:UDP-GlcNAc3NAcA epimerase
MMKVASIVGARPQFIKAAVVSSHLRAHPEIRETLIHTGQHYSQAMSDIFFDQLDIPKPDINLGVGKASPATQIGRMLIALEPVLGSGSFDWVFVYGDTNTTLAGALAAVKAGIPLAHVEAGLRSYDRRMPEETNRLAADHLADLLFTPTETADANLLNENITATRISRVGDVMYDSVLYYREKARVASNILDTLGLRQKDFLLCTIHRADNTDNPHNLETILRSMELVSEKIDIIIPLHPRTQAAIDKHQFGGRLSPRVHIIEPVSYLDMLQLEENARLIATDSGGVQKEAFFLGVPCVILRYETEWSELVEKGCHTLAPPEDAQTLTRLILASLSQPAHKISSTAIFGDGHAAEKIRDALLMAS